MNALTWMDISTAPRDGTWVLLYDPETSQLIYTGCFDDKFDSDWSTEKDCLEYLPAWTNYQAESFIYEECTKLNPTHWMPLPSPPTLSADND